MNWIAHPLTLEGNRVKLVPLSDEHFEDLNRIGADKRIWEFMAIKGVEDGELLTALKSAKLKRLGGEEYPFVVIDKVDGKVIGSTRYLDMHPEFRNLEIGWTWYDPAYWGSGYNEECKLLLLTYAFETLNCVRVQIKTRDNNLRSRAAIEKIGGTFEGVLRNHMIRHGEIRHTAMYSITNEEWPTVKDMLKDKITLK